MRIAVLDHPDATRPIAEFFATSPADLRRALVQLPFNTPIFLAVHVPEIVGVGGEPYFYLCGAHGKLTGGKGGIAHVQMPFWGASLTDAADIWQRMILHGRQCAIDLERFFGGRRFKSGFQPNCSTLIENAFRNCRQ